MGKLEEKIIAKFKIEFNFEDGDWIDGLSAISFLRQELLSYRREIVKEVLATIPNKQNFVKTLGVQFTSGYNSARKEIKRKIDSLKIKTNK